MGRSSDRQSGQAIALFALALAVILGALALVVDLGFAYGDRRYQQDAADAAALAGARLVFTRTTTDTLVKSAMEQMIVANKGSVDWAGQPAWYVDDNQNTLAPVGGGTIPGNATGVAVLSRVSRVGFFSWVLGINDVPVSAVGVAITQQVCTPPPGGLVPLTVPKDYLEAQCGQTVSNPMDPPQCAVDIELKSPTYHKTYGGDVPAEWKGVVDFSNEPNQSLCQQSSLPGRINCWTDNGFDGTITSGAANAIPGGDDLPTVNGDLGSATDMIRWIHDCDGGRQCGTIYLPIYDKYDPLTGTINVWGYAAFTVYLDELTSQGTVIGHLTRFDVPATAWQPYQAGCSSAFTIRLVPPNESLVLPTVTPVPTTGTAVPPTATTTGPTATPGPPTVTPPPPTRTPQHTPATTRTPKK